MKDKLPPHSSVRVCYIICIFIGLVLCSVNYENKITSSYYIFPVILLSIRVTFLFVFMKPQVQTTLVQLNICYLVFGLPLLIHHCHQIYSHSCYLSYL